MGLRIKNATAAPGFSNLDSKGSGFKVQLLGLPSARYGSLDFGFRIVIRRQNTEDQRHPQGSDLGIETNFQMQSGS